MEQSISSLVGSTAGRVLNEYTNLRIKSHVLYHINNVRWDAVAPPFKTLVLDTATITERYTPTPAPNQHKIKADGPLGTILSGGWDRGDTIEKLRDYWIYTGLRQRFEMGWEWDETNYVENAKKVIDNSGEIYGCSTVDEFKQNRCQYVEDLFDHIRKNGYNMNNNGPQWGENKKDQHLPPIILIDRDGSIILRHGLHRFTIADILDMQIPAYVRCRHTKWQETREDIASIKKKQAQNKSKKYTNYENHPDIDDISYGRS